MVHQFLRRSYAPPALLMALIVCGLLLVSPAVMAQSEGGSSAAPAAPAQEPEGRTEPLVYFGPTVPDDVVSREAAERARTRLNSRLSVLHGLAHYRIEGRPEQVISVARMREIGLVRLRVTGEIYTILAEPTGAHLFERASHEVGIHLRFQWLVDFGNFVLRHPDQYSPGVVALVETHLEEAQRWARREGARNPRPTIPEGVDNLEEALPLAELRAAENRANAYVDMALARARERGFYMDGVEGELPSAPRLTEAGGLIPDEVAKHRRFIQERLALVYPVSVRRVEGARLAIDPRDMDFVNQVRADLAFDIVGYLSHTQGKPHYHWAMSVLVRQLSYPWLVAICEHIFALSRGGHQVHGHLTYFANHYLDDLRELARRHPGPQPDVGPFEFEAGTDPIVDRLDWEALRASAVEAGAMIGDLLAEQGRPDYLMFGSTESFETSVAILLAFLAQLKEEGDQREAASQVETYLTAVLHTPAGQRVVRVLRPRAEGAIDGLDEGVVTAVAVQADGRRARQRFVETAGTGVAALFVDPLRLNPVIEEHHRTLTRRKVRSAISVAARQGAVPNYTTMMNIARTTEALRRSGRTN